MPNQLPPTAPAEVLVVDTLSPRQQVSSPSASNEVIVVDQSPSSINPTNSRTQTDAILVEDSPNPPKRRRRDNPTALPLHPRVTAPSESTPPVIVVEDDDDSSDPESSPTPTNPTPFTSVAPVASARPHVRLPRMNPPRSVPAQDDIVEMSARGPTISHTTASAATPLVPPIRPPPTPPTRTRQTVPPPVTPPTRTRHTSMPPLFSFTQRSTLGPEVAAPVPSTPSRSIPRPVLRQMASITSLQQHSNAAANPNASRPVAFPHPLPEQALPSTGRRSVRGNRHVSFSETIPEGDLTPGARATLTVLRGIEDRGIDGTGPPTGLPRHTGEPFIQVVNGPSVYLDTSPNSVQNAVPQSTTNGQAPRYADPLRQSSFSYFRRGQGPSARRPPVSETGNPMPSRSGVHRRFGAQGMSRAHLQQLNAMHAASNGMPLQDDGYTFIPQSNINTANSSSAPSHRMTVTAHLGNTSRSPGDVALAVDRATAATATAAAATATAMAGLPPTGMTVTTNQARVYGQGSTFTVSSSGSTAPGRHRNNSRPTNPQRQAHSVRRFHRLLRITGSAVTAGIEIQYLQGMHGDRALDYEQLIRLDEQLIREKNRAEKSQIDALPTCVATANDKEIRCCVCMCDVEEGEELRVLPCSHKYHKKCIDEWLTYNGCCPVDKKRIAPRTSHSLFTTS